MSRDRPLPRRFLVLVDPTEPSSEAVELAVELALAVDGTVTLLGVARLALPPAAVDGGGALALSFGEQEEQSQLDRIARERLEQLAAAIDADVDVHTVMGWGTADHAIDDELTQGAYDMIVVSTRHEGALGHLIHDHAIRKLLGHSPVPVLVVPARVDDES